MIIAASLAALRAVVVPAWAGWLGVLAGILALAADSRTVVRGSLLLVAYSAGLGFAFLVAGVAFARAMTVFRWLRDHYVAIQRVSGAVLLALGLLLFFHRDWWLRVALNRVLDAVGLGSL
jgi:cytochrome c-type biogenesis protein